MDIGLIFLTIPYSNNAMDSAEYYIASFRKDIYLTIQLYFLSSTSHEIYEMEHLHVYHIVYLWLYMFVY